MMQHVAIAKSEVAAFATGAQTNSFTGSESNEQFGKLLQDQENLHSLAGASEIAPSHTSSKKALQQSTDEVKRVPSSAVREGTIGQTNSTSNEQSETHNVQTSGLSNGKTATQSAIEGSDSDKGLHVETNHDSVSESAANNLNDELKVGNTKTELQLVLPSKQNDNESAVESANIVAQEWVALVDNLQKLADARIAKRPLVDVGIQSIDVPVI